MKVSCARRTCVHIIRNNDAGENFLPCKLYGRRDSVVGIATRYGLEDPGIESRWVEISALIQTGSGPPPSFLYNGYRVFPGGKGGRGVMLTTHTLLVPRLRKSWAIPPLTLWVFLGLLRGSLYTLQVIYDECLSYTLNLSTLNYLHCL
jgi:hypothetical protein